MVFVNVRMKARSFTGSSRDEESMTSLFTIELLIKQLIYNVLA